MMTAILRGAKRLDHFLPQTAPSSITSSKRSGDDILQLDDQVRHSSTEWRTFGIAGVGATHSLWQTVS
jgi:hypothetical protein